MRKWMFQVTCSVDPTRVLQIQTNGNKVVLFLGKEKLTKDEAKQLKVEVDFLRRSKLWSILQETVRQKAIEKAVLESKDWEQVLSGKLMLHNLGILQSIVRVLDDLNIDNL